MSADLHSKRVQAFLSGSTKVPDDWRIRMPTVPGEKHPHLGRLNFLSDALLDKLDPLWTPSIQALVVDVGEAGGRVIAYLGMEDVNGRRFVVPANYGILRTDQFAVHSTSNGAWATTTGSDDVDMFEIERVLFARIGKPILFVLYTFGPTTKETKGYDYRGMAAQAPLAKKLAYALFDSTKRADRGAPYLQRKFPSTINATFTGSHLDLRLVPFLFSLRTWPNS